MLDKRRLRDDDYETALKEGESNSACLYTRLQFIFFEEDSSGVGGYDIVVSGSNFGPAGTVSLDVGGTAGTLVTHNHTHLVITIPATGSGAEANVVCTVSAPFLSLLFER